MTLLSYTEENYLKAIFHLFEESQSNGVSTNDIAVSMNTRPASVTDMLKKLDTKDLVKHIKYQGVQLTEEGRKIALRVIRKHRLWEVFLVEKLNFNWDEVHDVAEQLEHIKSPLMIERLDEFLNFPEFDPHGDPIPREDGTIVSRKQHVLANLKVGFKGMISCMKEDSKAFLQYMDQLGINLNTQFEIVNLIEFDNSIEIKLSNDKTIHFSHDVAKNILVMSALKK